MGLHKIVSKRLVRIRQEIVENTAKRCGPASVEAILSMMQSPRTFRSEHEYQRFALQRRILSDLSKIPRIRYFLLVAEVDYFQQNDINSRLVD
jgi:hypothetical protein